MKRFIKFGTTFEGVHFWKEAPDEVFFLRNPHRHIFHVNVWVEVFTDDRDLEFITEKRNLESFLTDKYRGDCGGRSCEMIAEEIMKGFENRYARRRVTIEVLEDGENGAELYFDLS